MNGKSRLPFGILLLACSAAAQTTPAERLARWKPVDMPLTPALSAQEHQMIDKLIHACRLLDEIFWRQSDADGLSLYRSTGDAALKRLLAIMGSRWDLLDENRPFAGSDAMPPGHELYPRGLTRAQIEQYVAQHPIDRAAIYNPYTVIKRQGDRLIAVPYHTEYKQFLEPMAKDLRDAASLSDDPAFANFLRLRASAQIGRAHV